MACCLKQTHDFCCTWDIKVQTLSPSSTLHAEICRTNQFWQIAWVLGPYRAMLAPGGRLGNYAAIDCQSRHRQCPVCDVSLCLQYQVRLIFSNAHDFGLMRAYMHLRNHGHKKWSHRFPPIWVLLGKQWQWHQPKQLRDMNNPKDTSEVTIHIIIQHQ